MKNKIKAIWKIIQGKGVIYRAIIKGEEIDFNGKSGILYIIESELG